MTVLRALIFTLVAPCTIMVWIPWRWLRGAWVGAPWNAVAWAMIAGGAMLYLWCVSGFVFQGKGTPAIYFTRRLRFLIGEEPARIVTAGPYQWVRNPMYVGVLAVLAGEALLTGSGALLVYAGCVGAVFHGAVVLLEEPHLRRKRGEEYEAYCRRVGRWWPRLGGR